MYESDRKAWIRYPPPRWIWKGTAICGVPGEVSRAMLRGWHANNGVALGDTQARLRLHQAERRRPGRARRLLLRIRPSARARSAAGVRAPSRSAVVRSRQAAPALPVASWPKPRLEKAYRNYAMEYVQTAAPVMVQLFGPEDAGYLLHLTGKLIGMQYFDEIARGASARAAAAQRSSRRSCARCSRRRTMSPRSSESEGAFEIRQQSWKLMDDVADYHPACAKVLEGLFEGLAAGCGRHIPRASEADGGRQAAVHLVDRVGLSARSKCTAAAHARNAPAAGMAIAVLAIAAPAVRGNRHTCHGRAENWRAREKKCPISASPKSRSTRKSARCRRRRAPVKNALIDGPILRTLLRLAWPNVVALSRRHLRGDRGDLLYRPARRRAAGRDGAGVSLRDPDHDDVGRRDGRRRGVRDRARARRRRSRARLDACRACAADRHLLRARLHAGHADLRPDAAGAARRPRQCAGAGDRLYRRSSSAAPSSPG